MTPSFDLPPPRVRGPIIAGMLAATTLTLLAAAGASLWAAGQQPDRTGSLIAVFPPGTAEIDAMLGTARADGRLVRGTWLPGAWLVVGDAPTFSAKLKDAGAVLVLPSAGEALLALGGCSFSPPAVSRTPAAIRKLHGGPL